MRPLAIKSILCLAISMSAAAFFFRFFAWVSAHIDGRESRRRDMDYRPPRNCLAQFLPANELHSREIRKVGDWPTISNTEACPKTEIAPFQQYALRFRFQMQHGREGKRRPLTVAERRALSFRLNRCWRNKKQFKDQAHRYLGRSECSCLHCTQPSWNNLCGKLPCACVHSRRAHISQRGTTL
jgi:hypothetical protein